MSPIQPFKSVTAVIAEVSVWRYRMPEPQVGDILERDGDQVRCLAVRRRLPRQDPFSRTGWELEAEPGRGEYMLTIEYEVLESR